MDERRHLFDSLTEISNTLIAENTLHSMLGRFASLSVRAIDACDAAGVSVVRESEVVTAAGTDEFVREVDAIQYGTAEGPCLQAVKDNRSFVIDSMTTETRWPAFTRLASERGVKGCLSFPLVADGRPIGSLNLYSRTSVGFTTADKESGALLAAEAQGPIANMDRYARLRDLAQTLTEQLDSQKHEAIGILMERHKVSRVKASALLTEKADAADFDGERAAAQIVGSVLTKGPSNN